MNETFNIMKALYYSPEVNILYLVEVCSRIEVMVTYDGNRYIRIPKAYLKMTDPTYVGEL